MTELSKPLQVLEVGCGAGNTVFPLLTDPKSAQVFVHCCDYSSKAIEIVKQNPNYDENRCHAFVWDVTGDVSAAAVPPESLDIISCIYVLSAIPPELQKNALENFYKLLKPGGILLFKDYGQYDMTQLRFKKDRLINDNFYCRGDGTLVYFFTQDQLDNLFVSVGLSKTGPKEKRESEKSLWKRTVEKLLKTKNTDSPQMEVVNVMGELASHADLCEVAKLESGFYSCLGRIMRFDNLYYECAEIIRQVLNHERNVRSAIYASKFTNKKQLTRMCCDTLKHRKYFDLMLSSDALAELLKVPEYKPYCIIYVLLYEFLFGNKLRKCSPKLAGPIFILKGAILDEAERCKKSHQFMQTIEFEKVELALPVYARVNTIKWTMEKAMRALTTEGWTVKHLSNSLDFPDFKDSVLKMNSSEIFCDPHVTNLMVFPPGTDLHDHTMVKEGYVMLQDKASCLSSFLLNPKGESEVIDVCAAPGMKTSHLAAIMGNKGQIWAMDKAPDRVEVMKSILKKAGVGNVLVDCGDCLRLDVNDKKFSKIRYALVDPPCSGTGMIKRMDPFTNSSGDFPHARLHSLSNLQAMILKHVLRLPNLKRVVYSTCSICQEENEKVIQEILNDEKLGKTYKLVNALPEWSVRGSAEFSFGKKCIRATPEVSLTNGFFIAVFKKRKNSSNTV
uniref:SAM_MT_RSMB_NOP domain-containing protein n=1 Tax=Syphacia muris TaxID=451379 RepID=A0A0N5AJJ3_9BILA